MGRSGSELAAAWRPLSPDDREAAIVAAVKAKELPSFVTTQTWPTINRMISVDGKSHGLFLYMLPFLAYGTDADPLWYPCRQDTAQSIADELGAIILTPTLVREFFNASASKIPLQVPPLMGTLKGAAHDAYMQSPAAFEVHSALVNAEIGKSIAAGVISSPAYAAGHSKNLVLGPNLDGSHIAIYGGFNASLGYALPDGTWHPAVDGWAWQPYPGPHVLSWVDDSQLVGFVFRRGFLDGREIDVGTIFEDPVLFPLVADATPQTKAAGPFPPRFPTAFSPGKVGTGTGGGGGGGTSVPAPQRPIVPRSSGSAGPIVLSLASTALTIALARRSA